MGITNSNKLLDRREIACDGLFRIILSLAAAPDITSNPVDIVLVLDRSGSMAGTAIENLKLGADTFIDIIDESTDGSQDGNLGGGTRMAVVSFANEARVDTQLITSVADLKAAVNGLAAGGSTNHGDAFEKAAALLSGPSTNAKVMVMFTDGKTTIGPNPSPIAAAARAAGIVIYCIGLIGSDGIDVATLNDWATDPDSSHVAVTPDAADLETLFADLAKNISKPGATDIVITDRVNPDFEIVSAGIPTKGTVSLMQNRQARWEIDSLGTTANEGATLELTVRHVGTSGGEKMVNEFITYTDAENNAVTFPSPSILVNCPVPEVHEPCPQLVEVAVEGCQDTTEFDLGDVYLESQGKILELDLNLKNICPGKRTALAVILTETDASGAEYPRGMKILTIPAHYSPSCRDIPVKCIKFVLPDDLNVSCGGSVCCQRSFRARVISHYIDSEFDCCGNVQVTM